jgi:hypothetical protein
LWSVSRAQQRNLAAKLAPRCMQPDHARAVHAMRDVHATSRQWIARTCSSVPTWTSIRRVRPIALGPSLVVISHSIRLSAEKLCRRADWDGTQGRGRKMDTESWAEQYAGACRTWSTGSLQSSARRRDRTRIRPPLPATCRSSSRACSGRQPSASATSSSRQPTGTESTRSRGRV